MITDNNVLKSYISGAVSFDEKNGYLFPHRFSKKQFEYLAGSEYLYLRSIASAGVILEFYSDTRKLSADMVFNVASSRHSFSVDLYVDGVMTDSVYRADVESSAQLNIEFSLKPGRKKIQIYFPCLFEAGIKNLELDNGSEMTPIKNKRSFLFFGDSITQGYAAHFSSLTYTNIIARAFDSKALNQAIAGDVFNADNLDEALDFDPDTVFVAYGTNDWWSGYDMNITARAYIDKLAHIYADKEIYVILPIYRLDCSVLGGNAKLSFIEHRDAIARLCDRHNNVTAVDSIDFVPHYKEFYEDGFLHPNDKGFILYAQALEKYLLNQDKKGNHFIR